MDDLEQEQEDLAALLNADPVFATVTVIKEEKGDIENEVSRAIGTLNEKTGKIGAAVVVLQPDEVPTDPDTPNPELRVRFSVQVFDTPLFNDSEQGTGQDIFTLSRRVRQLLHRRSFGTGMFSWLGTEPVSQTDPSRRSRMVTFSRLAQEDREPRAGAPLIEPEDGGATPAADVTITPPAGAAAYYTTDGELPVPGAANTTLYSAPITIVEPCLLRAISVQTGYQVSNVSQATFS